MDPMNSLVLRVYGYDGSRINAFHRIRFARGLERVAIRLECVIRIFLGLK